MKKTIKSKKEVEPEEIGFILKSKSESGDLRVISGVLNKKTGKVNNTSQDILDKIDYEL